MDNYKNSNENPENYGWQQLAQPQYAENDRSPITEEYKIPVVRKKNFSHSSILTFQLVLCIFVLIFLFLSKTFLPSVFYIFKDTYDKEINTSMFFSGDFQDLDFTDMFTATNDEI